jgi:hypothetical protein
MRTVPLFKSDDYPGFFQNQNPLQPGEFSDSDYLQRVVGGNVAVVCDGEALLNAYESEIEEIGDVDSVTARRTSATSSSDYEKPSEQLFEADRQFDHIVYHRKRLQYMARFRDFQRLTPHVVPDGSIHAKTKWLPNSKEMSLESVAVIGGASFAYPDVYLRYRKHQSIDESEPMQRTDCEENRLTQASLGGEPSQKPLSSQFRYGTTSTEYKSGWRWHSHLQEFARQWASQFDGPVANLCCGQANVGDIRVDRVQSVQEGGSEMETAATHIMDARNLDLKTNSVEAVISDPPWKIPVEDRISLFSEAVRIARSKILYNSWYIPYHPYCQLNDVRVVLANQNDGDLDGPGGLSFLSEISVGDIPGFGGRTFTLEKWASLVGPENIRESIPNRCDPYSQPAADPRIVSGRVSTSCAHCRTDGHYEVRQLPSRPIYDCHACGYPNEGEEIIPGAASLIPRVDEPEQVNLTVGKKRNQARKSG